MELLFIMATYGKTLLDNASNKILPKTRSSLVYMDDNITVEDRFKYVYGDNLLDNSNFKIWQRGDKSGELGAGSYTADRWSNGSGQSSFEKTSIGAKQVSGATPNVLMVSQILEHSNGTFDFTYQVSLKTSGPFYLCIFPDNDGNNGTSSQLFQAQSSLNTVIVTFRNITITNGVLCVAIRSGYTTATRLTVEVAWEKLEHGVIATPYIAKHPSVEIDACFRYYRGSVRVNAIKTTGSYYTASYRFHMRNKPVYTLKAFSPYGNGDVTNMNGCSMSISSLPGNYGTGSGFYVAYCSLPTCTSFSSGAIMFNLSADF